MKKFILIIIFCCNLGDAYSIETKIIHNIQNEIITNIDIKNEFRYLLALNNNLKKLNKEKVFLISNESIIKETIKKIEVTKNFKEIKINDDYLEVLVKNIYSKLNLGSLQEFKLYLKDYDLTLGDIEKKLTIEALWNEVILQKYTPQITINMKQIKNKITNNQKKKIKEYKLSEIFFEIKNSDDIKKKYNEIKNSISQIGFENSSSIYSFSESAKVGGDIGWINSNSLSEKIKKQITNLKIGEITKPIILPNGILILKLSDIRSSKIEINYDLALNQAISYERNRQLNQYSKIYYNKIKKNIGFNE